MADLRPPQSGEPYDRGVKSFAAALVGGAAAGDSSCSLLDIGACSSLKGEPVFLTSREAEMKLVEPLSNALVGPFAFFRPSMESIRKFFMTLGLRGACVTPLLLPKAN